MKITNTNKIIASFASISTETDKLKIKGYANKLYVENVVASITQYNKEIEFENFKNLIENLKKNTSFFTNKNNKFIVINIGIDKPIEPKLKIEYEYLKVFDVNIYTLINGILNTNELLTVTKTLTKLIRNKKVENEKFNIRDYTINLKLLKNFKYLVNLNLLGLMKNENHLLLELDYNFIFIFNDITWSNIVFLFKLSGINLYGGSNNRRHLLSTVQIKLTTFLFLINNFEINNNLIYESFNNITKLNTKIDYEIVSLIKQGNYFNTDNIFEIIANKGYIVNRRDNEIYYLKINMIIRLYLLIKENLDNLDDIKLNIHNLNILIKEDKERIEKHSQIELINNLKINKINRANTRINNFNVQKEKLNQKRESISQIYIKNVKNLYNFEKSLFDKKGICLLNDKIQINLDKLKDV